MNVREYLGYFDLTEQPFSKDISTDRLLLLPSARKALAAAALLAETRGIGVMSGKSGVGKSCLLRQFIADLPTGLYKPVYICHTTVAITEFYTHLCTAFGIVPSVRRSNMFRDLQDRIRVFNQTNHVHPILIIDEAHYLATDILTELRLIANFEIDSLSAMSILLCGSESFPRRFTLSVLEPLANSITISIPVATLPQEETVTYVENRLAAVGAQRPLFTKNALAFVHQASGGVLRSVNTIATASLHRAFLSKSPQVEAEHVQSVVQ
jgi:general secretion pathway protein A